MISSSPIFVLLCAAKIPFHTAKTWQIRKRLLLPGIGAEATFLCSKKNIVMNNEYLNDQKQIINDLLKATLQDYAENPRKEKGSTIIGAKATVLSYRDSSNGILAGVIARSILPNVDEEPCEEAISMAYPLEQLMAADIFELHSFHNGTCAFLRCANELLGSRTEFHVYPDTAQDGLLIRLEWHSSNVVTITVEDLVNALKNLLSQQPKESRLFRKPEVWFNGVRVVY